MKCPTCNGNHHVTENLRCAQLYDARVAVRELMVYARKAAAHPKADAKLKRVAAMGEKVLLSWERDGAESKA